MTSANVTEYRILNSAGDVVGQHHYCKTKWDELLEYHPLEDHKIQAFGYDEEEEYWESEVEDLYDFLVNVREIQLK